MRLNLPHICRHSNFNHSSVHQTADTILLFHSSHLLSSSEYVMIHIPIMISALFALADQFSVFVHIHLTA